MHRCTYLDPDNNQRKVLLDERCAAAVALMVAAARAPDPARARIAQVLGGPTWESPKGLLAAHALAVSAVHVATTLISVGPDLSPRSRDLDLICKLAAELRPLAEALDRASLSSFDAVGVTHQLPGTSEVCANTHSAVRQVLADVTSRLTPILTSLGLLSDAEPPAALAERARENQDQVLASLQHLFAEQYFESFVHHWPGWASVERTLVAEVAAAARVGLIPAEDGAPLDQERFDAAVAQVLAMQDEAARQYLLARWRWFATMLQHLRPSGMLLPSLMPESRLIEGLERLTMEVLSHSADATQAPGLLELLSVLRALRSLAIREQHVFDSGGAAELDADFRADLRPIIMVELPRALCEANTDVDAIVVGTTSDARLATSSPSASLRHREVVIERQVHTPAADGVAAPNSLPGSAPAEDTARRRAGTANRGTHRGHHSSSKDGKHDAPPQRQRNRRQRQVRERQPTAMQMARWSDILIALPPSDRIAMDSPGVLLSKLRTAAAQARTRERIAVRHDKDSLRRDLVALRARGWVDPKLLLRTPDGDRQAQPIR